MRHHAQTEGFKGFTMTLETIEGALPSMPPIYRKIALFILENYQSVGFLSIYSLSEKIGVSTASIVRFTKSLGFDGYSNLKKALQDELRLHFERKDRLKINDLEPLPSELQFNILRENEENNMKQTLSGLEAGTMDSIIEGILAANRIYTCGIGLSSHIMELLAFSFICILPKEVISLKGAVVEYSCRFNTCSSGDIVFVADFPPYSGEIVHVAEHAHKRGARLVLFTDSPRCPAYVFAQTVIRCENNSIVMANSYVGLITSLQILINMLFLKEKPAISQHIFSALEISRTGYEMAKIHTVSEI
ncbi:MAG: MurR/RpiR family transcriptional regulator [Rectinemataceae bacterium]|nr:MurR/RpiR family transcriptional regulator [Rectinemataceae bacterium]